MTRDLLPLCLVWRSRGAMHLIDVLIDRRVNAGAALSLLLRQKVEAATC